MDFEQNRREGLNNLLKMKKEKGSTLPLANQGAVIIAKPISFEEIYKQLH